MTKKIYHMFGIEWCMPIIALIFIDPSVAMLSVMFAMPFIVLLLCIRTLIFRFKPHSIPEKVFRILKITSVVSAISVSSFLIFMKIQTNSPIKMFELTIVDPVPGSVKNIQYGGKIYAVGSSSFFMTFDINPTDFEKMLRSNKFSAFYKNDVMGIFGRKPELYQRVLDESKVYLIEPSDFYIFEHANSVYRFDALITNKDHTRVYYRSF